MQGLTKLLREVATWLALVFAAIRVRTRAAIGRRSAATRRAMGDLFRGARRLIVAGRDAARLIARASGAARRAAHRAAVRIAHAAGTALRLWVAWLARVARAAGRALRLWVAWLARVARAAGRALRLWVAWLARVARAAGRALRLWVAWLARVARAAGRVLRLWVAWLARVARITALALRRGAVRIAGALGVWLACARRAAGPYVRAHPRAAVIVVASIVGIGAAGLNTGTLSLFPPGLRSSDLAIAGSKTQVMFDSPASGLSITRQETLPQDLQSLVRRAEFMGQVLVTAPVLDRIARRAGVPRDELSGISRLTANVALALSEPGSERRAADIRDTQYRYRIEVQARPLSPILDIYAQGDDPAQANRLANAAVEGLKEYLRELAERQAVPAEELLSVRRLGSARGGVVSGRAPLVIGVLTFLVAFALAAGALMYGLGLRRRRRAPQYPDAGGSWPRTTRVLPWMLAGFIVMLWLTPFHQIELTMSTPIDMKLDRLLLPFLAGLWLLALGAGGRSKPRLPATWIHAAVGAFVMCAFLSVVLDAPYLARTLELDESLKKLPLLVSYVSLFVIASSAVRRTEVRAFLTLTLGLGVIVAVGLIFEYRFKQNLFWDYADKLLPGMFVLDGQLDGGAVDHMGRRLVRGPAEVPLEVVTMLSIALPVALVGLMQTSRWRGRILYGVSACLLVAAMFATFRKSGLLAPISVVLVLAYFRRRELLKLAPLGMVLVVAVSALSPGALQSTVGQFTRSDRASLPTVSDRSADYDAVRPDVWSHLAFGRGWGSYNHIDYRILDSEILHRTIEMGVIGLLAFLLIGGSVVLCTRRTIISRDPEAAPLALIGAAAAVAFLVASTFYDVLSFPHATYIFLYVAGLVAVVVEGPPAPDEGTARRRFLRRPVARRHGPPRPARPLGAGALRAARRISASAPSRAG